MLELNKIHLGDCLELMKKIPDKSIDLVLTDPPYGMSYLSSRREVRHEVIQDDDNFDWLPEFLSEIYRVQKDNTHCYMFCNDYGLGIFRSIAKDVGYTIKRTLIWIKNNHTSGDLEGDYGNITEFCLFLHKGRKLLKGKRENNLLKFDRTDNELHPTQKPIVMMKYLLEKSSNEGDIVLDPFLGSGTTAIACKEMGRNYIGIEKEKKYVDIANKRLETASVGLFIQ